jgi:Flp pilus assembly protein TadG
VCDAVVNADSPATVPARAARRPGSALHAGQTLVIFALAQLVLLGALGLAIDGGFLYSKRRAMQNAADAAAMTGAGAISRDLTDTAVTQAVLDSAARNGVTDWSKVTCKFLTNSYPSGTTRTCTSTGEAMSALDVAFSGVEVRVSETHSTFVMRALGIKEAGTAATAAAQVQVATKVKTGPFMVCALDTAVESAPNGFDGGIFEDNGNFPDSGRPDYIRDDGNDNCDGESCLRTEHSGGTSGQRPVYNEAAFAYEDAAEIAASGATPSGPVFLIHDPSGSNGITRCNNNSSSFKGINLNSTFMQFPAGQDYWDEGANTPDITTGNVTSVEATVEGVNGCVAGAEADNCIMILPLVDNSGPGGTGSTALLAVRTLGAFYVRESRNGEHTGELIKHYNIVAESGAYFAPGMSGPTVIRLIK